MNPDVMDIPDNADAAEVPDEYFADADASEGLNEPDGGEQQLSIAERAAKIPFEPLHDLIFVLPTEPLSISKGGIHLPDVAKERPTSGIVLKIGPGTMNTLGEVVPPQGIVVGCKVFYDRYGGRNLDIGGVDFKILRYTDLLGFEPA